MTISLIFNYIFPFLISYFLIKGFYKAFKNTWPELYFSTSDYTSLFISVSPWRYFAFTLLPTLFITSIVIGFYYHNHHITHLNLLGIIVGLFHALSSNGVACWKLLRNDKTVQTFFNKPFQIAMHLVTILALAITGYISGYLSTIPFILAIIPSIEGIVDNLWSSLFASVLTVFLLKIYSNKHVDSTQFFNQSKNNIPASIIKKIKQISKEYSANENLVLAICIVENMQRPNWVRFIEKAKSFIFKRGTYGIMQTSSDKYINDNQSIELAVERFFKNTNHISLTYPPTESLDAVIRPYNNDDTFVKTTIEAYHYLTPIG